MSPIEPAAIAWRRLQALNRRLLAEPSATAVLEAWCGGAAGPAAPIQVRKGVVPPQPLPPALRSRLAVGPDETVEYRQVALVHAGVIVSEAENWYCPARLEPGMRDMLEHSDRPFGRVVEALGFVRHTLGVDWLWSFAQPVVQPLPWALLRHQAVLQRADGLPFSAVIETYTRGVLAFGDPHDEA